MILRTATGLLLPCLAQQLLGLLLATVLLPNIMRAQANSPNTQPLLVNPSRVPSPVRAFIAALGDRVQKPGKERTTLVGTYSESNGAGSSTFIWEAPGRARFDRGDQPGKPIIYDDNAGLVNAAALTPMDTAILESLLDDCDESFSLGFAQLGYSHRLLGERFRADDGRTANYKGPLYDIYEVVGSVNAKPGKPSNQKFYYFDSQTKLLAKVVYIVPGSSTKVSTQFTGWTTTVGQSTPGQVVRTENGVVVFQMTVTSATFGPATNDGKFPGH